MDYNGCVSVHPPCIAATFKFSFRESDSAVAALAAETAAAAALATSMAAEMALLLPRLHRFFRIELSRCSLRPLAFVVVDSSSESDIWRRQFNIKFTYRVTMVV